MSPIDQHVFLANLKNGDAESFTALYNAYYKKIYTLIYRMVGNQSEAEELTQETFLQVYWKVDSFQGHCQLSTWIYTIAKNLCYRVIQQHRRTTMVALETLISTAQNQAIPDDLAALERRALINQVKEGCLTGLVRCLPFSQRLAFILHVLIKLPIKAVATILEKSEGATKVLIYRARQRLKAFLCQHCSCYNPKNPCRCENLIHFSLEQGWIAIPTEPEMKPGTQIDPGQIEAELEGVKKVVALYQSLNPPKPPEELGQRLQELIKNQPWTIFSARKV